MAIEFRCPYCEATIRVADSAPGRVGKCPKCNTKMVVPKPSAALPSLPANFGNPGAVAPPENVFPPVIAPPSVPDDEPVLLEENDTDLPDIQFAAADEQALGAVTAPIEPAPIALPTNLVPVIVPIGPARRVVRKRKARRPQVMWLIAAVMGLGLSVAAGFVIYREVFNGKLDGELIGAALEDPQLPPVTVPRVSLEMVASALDPLLTDLAAQPVPLVSELMEIKIGGSKDGLVITVDHGPHMRWYRVDAKSHPALADFASKHEKTWSATRTKKLDEAANAFLRDYRKVREKEADSSVMPPYRDSLALNALVKGLGAHTVAVVGRTVYPCVYEQSDGSLYFLLPARLKSFALQGKPQADGKPGTFQGEFRVMVKPEAAAAKPVAPVETKPEVKPEPEAMETPEETSDEKPDQTKGRKKKRAKKTS